ncbi:hypothetical protein EV356DRAFT_493112 [Viridothelium virens]|uniref:Zn(2)-C6 fungal-type domain-containing protein n=1 Tax=Viridothelium virens TaxID=1048519 RepID=A0A6A6GW29_VIRVR|nr:hypothetical protein EV356DRAFT_493112 [Viridothelium virens]
MDSLSIDQSNGINYNTAPPIMNPPPQIFGGFNAEGSPLSASLQAGMFSDEQLFGNGDDIGGQGDAKRRRIARACDMCRKKKIKCDGKQPCGHCQNYKTECVFTHVEKKRNPPKGAKYIEGLENRLGRMESLLRLSGLLSEEDGSGTDLGTLERRLQDKTASKAGTPNRNSDSERSNSTSRPEPPPQPPSQSEHTTPQQPALASPASITTSPDMGKENKSEEEVEALSDMMCSLVTNNCGETRYIGSSSGFSIFSPKGIQWVNEKTGDSSFQDMISSAAVDDNKWIHWKPEIFKDIFNRRIFQPLPSKNEALSLLKDYFENFNCMFPLFHEPTFMHLVEKHYSRDPYEGSGWWASLNVALAIAHRLRVMSNLVPQQEDQKAWGYLKNALAVQTELTIRNTDLLSVQALLGMALFLQGTPNPQPSFFLVAAAIRLSHSIGLHKRGSGFNLNPVEIEQRKRVFWIAYMLDRDICLRSGRPPIQDDDDMNVDLPSEDPDDNIGNIPLADGKGKVNLFRLMCTFAVIESKVYKQLYSVKASKQSDGELLNTIGELDRELEEWKDGIPLDFRPEHEIKASHTPLILHVVVLHFAYYNCLTTIHRMSVHHGYWTSRLSNYAIKGLNARPLNPRVFSSAALCVSAARASIHLIKYIPQGDYDCVWLILYYPVSALVTLFANILQNPQEPRARSDLRLMNLVVSFLSMLCTEDAQHENASVRRMLSVCSEFERIAKVVLDRGDREHGARRKRSREVQRMREREREEFREQQERERDVEQFVQGSAERIREGSQQAHSGHTPRPQHRHTPSQVSTPGSVPFTPGFGRQDDAAPAGGAGASSQHPFTFSPPNGAAQMDHPPAFPEFQSPPATSSGLMPPDLGGLNGSSPQMLNDLGLGESFQQPFVPQDLWQMPMTLEWDWADMTGYGNNMGMPGFEGSPQGNGTG